MHLVCTQTHTHTHTHSIIMDASGSNRKLSQWPIFSLLDASFMSGVKMACVFGSTGNEALVITRDDEVYALGSNCSSCLGLGDTKNSFQPRKVETLCKQGGLEVNSCRVPDPVLRDSVQGHHGQW